MSRLSGDNVEFALEKDALRISARRDTSTIQFKLTGIPCKRDDLFVSVTMRAKPMEEYRINDMPRLVKVSVPESDYTIPDIPRTGGINQELEAYVDGKGSKNGFYFRQMKEGTTTLECEIEGDEPVWISSITVHAHPDARVREYENGVVLANPSYHKYVFDIGGLFPKTRLRRLRASVGQDPDANSGERVGANVALDALDALFLVKE
jgi:hypothetical protein